MFFLSINTIVVFWLAKRKQNGLSPLPEAENFVVVDEELFQEYDSFKENHNKAHIELLLPSCDLLIHYMWKKSMSVHRVDLYGEKFVDFPPTRMDGDYVSGSFKHEEKFT